MSMLPPSEGASARAARRIRARESGVRASIEQRFATRRARRSLVVAWSAVLVASAALPLVVRLQDAFGPAFVIGGSGARLVSDPAPAFIVTLALGWIVRTAVRRVADLPDEDIDERQVALRDRSYLVAYRVGFTVILMLLVAAYLVADAAGTRPLSGAVADWIMSDALFVGVPLFVFLPSAVIAWYAPDEEEEEEEG